MSGAARRTAAIGLGLALAVAALFAGCRSRAAAPAPAATPASTPADATAADGTLLGGERGLDHVGIAVKDLAAATHTYHDLLGFSRPTEGKLPNGIRNVNYYFADSTYLETLVHWDRTKAAWLADFTDKHEGGVFAVLAALSPEATTAFLARRGVKVGTPFDGTIEVAGQPAPDGGAPVAAWQTLFLPDGQLPGDPLFFISYPRGPREAFLGRLRSVQARRQLYHDNTAVGLRAVWIAVPDLPSATRAYEAIGLSKGRSFVDAALGARGQVFAAGAGEIWLVAPASPSGAVAAFLGERGGPGIIGVTIAAGNLVTAARLISERTGRTLPTYEGALGASFRVPPDLTHGVWIEFAQHLVGQKAP